MGIDERSSRWQNLVDAREELDADEVVMPRLVSRIDGRPLKPSPAGRRFAEALAVETSWFSSAARGEQRRAA
jgi:hypothetical protein